MSRREYCEGQHDWVPRDRAEGFRCSRCPAVFPCASNCAHFDCVEVRGKDPSCGTCGQPVPIAEAFFTLRGDKMTAHHPTCIEQHPQEQDHEHTENP